MNTRSTSLFIAFASLFLASAAHAERQVWARGVVGSVGSIADYGRESLPVGSGSPTGPVTFSDAERNAKVGGYVDYNAISLLSDVTISDNTKGGAESAIAQGRFADAITINAPGRAGQGVIVIFEFLIEGSVTGSGGIDPSTDTFAQYTSEFRGTLSRDDQYAVNPDGNPRNSNPNILNQKQTITNGINNGRFGEPINVVWTISTWSRGSTLRPQSLKVDITRASMRVLKVMTSQNEEITNYTVTSESGTDYTGRSANALWIAGRDFVKHEKPDRPAEAQSTNSVVPEWKYGSRTVANGTGVTLFSSGDHQNAITSADIEGFAVPGTLLTVATNTGGAGVVRNLGSGNHRPLLPGQLLMHPGSDGNFAVARWTAPTAGRYNIVARWLDLDPNGGNGISCHLVVNGEGRFEHNLENGGIIDMPSQTVELNAGETIDFVVGGRGDAGFDSTGLNAAISIAPAVELVPAPAGQTNRAAKGAGGTSSVAAIADSTVAAGSDVTFTAQIKFTNPASTVELRDNGKVVGRDNTAPYQFTIENINAGLHTLQAVAIDARGVEGASQTVRVLAVTSSSQARAASSGPDELAAASDISGDMFSFNKASGSWDDPNNWTRLSDGAVGVRVPGPDDAAILGADPVSVTLNSKFEIGILVVSSGSRLAGQEFFPKFDVGLIVLRSASITNCDLDGFELSIQPGAELDLSFEPRFKNLAIYNNGAITCHNCGETLGDAVSEIRNSGTVTIQPPPASNQPTALVTASYFQNGGQTNIGRNSSITAGQLLLNGGRMHLISDNSSAVISTDSSSLLSDNGSGLIGDAGSGLIGLDGSSARGPDGAPLISENGGGLISENSSTVPAPLKGPGEQKLRAATSGDPITLGPGATLTGTGNVVGSLINNGGYVSPGRSGGVIRITGDYTQKEEGTLLLEVGGTSANPPQFDQLQVRGTANLGGNLIVRTIDGFTPPSGDTFAALTYNSVNGSFASISSNAQVSFGANGMTMQVSGANPPAPKALNIATRMRVETGDNVLIAGFIITGSQPKKVIIRGIGPSLPFGGVLNNPTLNLDNGAMTNDNWRTNQEQEIIATTIPPSHNLESAIVATLDPGPHTAILAGAGGATGIGVVEVYDLDSGSPVQLANISSRGFVQSGDNVMIGGFIIGGNHPTTVIIRAIGPSLPFPGVLQNPTLELVDSNGSRMTNDNWRSAQEVDIIATTVAPSHDKESAIVATLVPGAYTAVVRGKDNTTGIAVVEAYNLQ